MTAPLHPTSATHREAGGVARAGVLTQILRFWLSDWMLLIGTAGFLAGYLVMKNAETQLTWMVATCHPAFLAACLRKRGDGIARDPLLILAMVFLIWNLTVGIVRNHAAFAVPYTGEFFTGSLLLPIYLGCVWMVCRMEGGAQRILRVLMWCGMLAAVVGLIYWRFIQVLEEPGARLRNRLVHEGQHPVSTAMCLSFAAVITAMTLRQIRTKAWRRALLLMLAVMMLAIMLTLSRGALLALACVPLAFLAAMGGAQVLAILRKRSVGEAARPYKSVFAGSWPAGVVAGAVAVTFLFFGGHLAPAPPAPPDLPQDARIIYLERLNRAPLNEYLARESNGRTNVYRIGLSQIDTWDKHLTGAGLWGPEIKLQEITARELGSSGLDHFHSIFIATYIHGGIVGSLLLGAILILGLGRTLTLLRAGQPEWFALLTFGLAALVADGQSMCSLITHPRFESFILWFPLVGASACWSRLQTVGRQPSSNPSR